MFSGKWIKSMAVFLALSVVLCVFAAAREEYAVPAVRTKPMRGSSMEGLSNRHVHPFGEQPVTGVFTDTEGFTLITQTGDAELWLSERYDTIRVRNRKTGYVWGGLPLEDAEGLNRTWSSYGNSIAAIECFDAQGIERRYGMSENAVTTYTVTDNGFICHTDFTKLGISFDVRVSLHGNKLNLSLPEDSMIEGAGGSEFVLKSVSFLPYLGAVYGDTLDGYLFIPDGAGALIRFQKPAAYASTYDKKIYGRDLSIESSSIPSDLRAYRPNDYTIEEQQVVMPVYGVVHGAKQNGLFMVVDEGDIYASIAAAPAIPGNPYNRVMARFEYRQKYTKNINRKEGAGTSVPQEHRNELSPELSVYILDGSAAHYDGMAVLYRDRLQKAGVLSALSARDAIPLRLEILGADKKRQFIGTSTQTFTTAEQADEIVSSLIGGGISNLSLVYRCFTKNNEAGASFLGGVGQKSDFKTLAGRVAEQGGRFNLYLNPLSANAGQIHPRTQAANNLTNMVIKLTRPSWAVMYPETYFYRLTEADKRTSKALDYGDFNYAVDQLSYRLYGDYTSGKESTRAQNLQGFMGMAERITGGGKTPMYRPNQYMWQYVSEFYDAPLVGSQLLYETDTVPFLQMVLSGSMDLFGTTMNTGTFSTDRLLRHIEYGVYPSFIVSGCDSIDLYRTAQEDFFSAHYYDWEEYILEAYQTIGGALAPLYGRRIVGHTAIESGFIKVSYAEGTLVYVNYTDEAKTDGDVTVEPSWYAVVNAR